ncbi:unnamed protein product [Haemonchus placei]|uniref:Uncharacterized protein n=1 Tax=Haemonchus placei TaxID=6290 RepID=A0A0N4WKF6_HAEPC|nr:unnamed protein product [Haemonchus placei]
MSNFRFLLNGIIKSSHANDKGDCFGRDEGLSCETLKQRPIFNVLYGST